MFLTKEFKTTGEEVYEVDVRRIFESLRNKYGILTNSDIQAILDALDAPFAPQNGQLIADYIAIHAAVHDKLAIVNNGEQAYNEQMKIRIIKNGLAACGLYQHEINLTDDCFKRTRGTTFDEWSTEVKDNIARAVQQASWIHDHFH
jgi:hypothetical protein